MIYLERMADLLWLHLDGTQVTEEAIDAFHNAVPRCRVFW